MFDVKLMSLTQSEDYCKYIYLKRSFYFFQDNEVNSIFKCKDNVNKVSHFG